MLTFLHIYLNLYNISEWNVNIQSFFFDITCFPSLMNIDGIFHFQSRQHTFTPKSFEFDDLF